MAGYGQVVGSDGGRKRAAILMESRSVLQVFHYQPQPRFYTGSLIPVKKVAKADAIPLVIMLAEIIIEIRKLAP